MHGSVLENNQPYACPSVCQRTSLDVRRSVGRLRGRRRSSARKGSDHRWDRPPPTHHWLLAGSQPACWCGWPRPRERSPDTNCKNGHVPPAPRLPPPIGWFVGPGLNSDGNVFRCFLTKQRRLRSVGDAAALAAAAADDGEGAAQWKL